MEVSSLKLFLCTKESNAWVAFSLTLTDAKIKLEAGRLGVYSSLETSPW
jgi:hypothetical protein